MRSVYNKLVQRAFSKCVRDFRTSSLDKKESKCVNVVAEKYLRHSQRTGARFAEHQGRMQARMQSQMAGAVGGMGGGTGGAGAGQ